MTMRKKFKKQWVGESGYCNCLLVVMSRVPLLELELRTDRELPDLELLTYSRPDTAEWIRTQELNVPNLDPRMVINILLGSATMGRWPWSKNTGTINVVDCVGDNGPTVDRLFTLRRSKLKNAVRLKINLNEA